MKTTQYHIRISGVNGILIKYNQTTHSQPETHQQPFARLLGQSYQPMESLQYTTKGYNYNIFFEYFCKFVIKLPQ